MKLMKTSLHSALRFRLNLTPTSLKTEMIGGRQVEVSTLEKNLSNANIVARVSVTHIT